MKTGLMCRCGHRITRRDVMQQGIYMRQSGPNYVYLKYRCARCKKLDERYIKHEEWEDSLLQETGTEQSFKERTRFAKMGAITLEEMRRFHHELEGMQRLPDLTPEDAE